MEYQPAYLSNFYRIENHGYESWYQNCNCCPYGYHIDLDFVRYCESIGQQADRTGSIKKRRDRRRQRQSMEVLLGLEPPALLDLEKSHQKVINEEPPITPRKLDSKQSHLIENSLEEAVSDFERTLQRSNNYAHNLPDVTAVHDTIHRVLSISSMSSASGSSMTVLPSTTDGTIKDYDAVIEMYGLSPAALQNVREQMALSLERTKELEEQVKLIPSLQAQLSVLKEEKRQLLLQIKSIENAADLNVVNGNYVNSFTTPYSRLRSHSLTHSASCERINRRDGSFPIPRRDVGITCTVLTRNIGVGHQHPHTKSVATTTLNGDMQDSYSDKWFSEKIKFLSRDASEPITPLIETRKPIVITKGTQTTLLKEKRHISSQTVEKVQTPKYDRYTQTLESKKIYHNVGSSASVITSDASSATALETNTIGTSDHTINDVICSKCDNDKMKLSPGDQSSTISLASLSFPRSKSFNLGEEKLNLRNRTIGCQYEPLLKTHKACQHELQMHSKSCQNELKVVHKGIQFESFSVSKITDTKDLELDKKNVACNTPNVKINTSDASSNTAPVVEPPSICLKCCKKEKEEPRKDETALPSRIPRLQIPTTPVEVRKFRRQDTYTKISPSSAYETSGLSGLDLSSKHDNELPSPLEKAKQTCKLSEVSTSQNGVDPSAQVEVESSLPIPETDLCHSVNQTQRKKVKPSKEMQGAMKVLNDSLQKGQTKNLRSQLKNAINIIQQEWFKISSLINADPLDVEDYLDCFEDVSYHLLRDIVNMVDASGNTAMHYAVSHGNFDVVSILLDSKVCDINQPNKAGYTSVMLVSLAEVCSPTHANVVRRLFQLADVNIRAKQHGQTALMLAVSHGRLDMVQMLLEAGADINIQDEDGSTALMCAAEHGHIDIVKHFLSQPDCDSTIIDVDGSTALKIAMEAGHRHIGVLLYAHERNLQAAAHSSKAKRSKSASTSPKTPSSPLSVRSSRRALPDKSSK